MPQVQAKGLSLCPGSRLVMLHSGVPDTLCWRMAISAAAAGAEHNTGYARTGMRFVFCALAMPGLRSSAAWEGWPWRCLLRHVPRIACPLVLVLAAQYGSVGLAAQSCVGVALHLACAFRSGVLITFCCLCGAMFALVSGPQGVFFSLSIMYRLHALTWQWVSRFRFRAA
jgi:hypothetical protein